MKRLIEISYSIIILFIGTQGALGQNCSVNAGVSQVICKSQILLLKASSAGNVNTLSDYEWKLVSGSSATINTPLMLQTTVTDLNPGTYIFQFSANCRDGNTAVDSVRIKVLPEPAMPLAGTDQQHCTIGTFPIAANIPPAGQTGQWLLVPGIAGMSIDSANNASAKVVVTSGGLKRLIWRISNTACSIDDSLDIRVLNPLPVSAGDDITMDCGGSCITLNGSDPGLYPQVGYWQLISGPNVPVIANPNLRNTSVCKLLEGTYTFKWNVTGPCRNGSDIVQVKVLNTFNSPNLGPSLTYTSFCTTSHTTELVLKANSLVPGESGLWNFVSGPTTPNISSVNSSSTRVDNLNGSGIYQFKYSVKNNNCARSVFHTIYFQNPITNLSTPVDQQLSCGSTSTTVNINFSGITNTIGLTRNGILVSGPVTSGVTAVRSGLTPNDVWTLSGMTEAGKYVFRFEYRNACSAMFRDVSVYISREPSASNAGSYQLIPCNATSTFLNGSVPSAGSGKWSQISGPNLAKFANSASPSPVVSNLIEGAYRFRWTVKAGNSCLSTHDDVHVVKATKSVAVADAGADFAVCPGSFKLNGNDPGPTQTGKWSVANGPGISFSDINDPLALVSGAGSNTAYTFTWTISNACSSSSDEIVVTTNSGHPLQVPNAGADECLGSGTTAVHLSGNRDANGQSLWTALNGGIIMDSASAVTTAIIPANGTYRFVYSLIEPGCFTLSDTVTYTVSAATSAAKAGDDQIICTASLPQAALLSASAHDVGTGIWEQLSGNSLATIDTPSNSETEVGNLDSGQYAFRYKITNGVCASTEDTVLVNITYQPTGADAGEDISQCDVTTNTVIILAANNPSIGTGTWTIVSGPQATTPVFSNPGSPNTTITGLSTGVYQLRWTTATGTCAKSTDDMMLTIARRADVSATGSAYCDVSSVQLTGNLNTSGRWTLISQPPGTPVVKITSVSPESAVADNLTEGTYEFMYEIPAIGGCQASSSNRSIVISSASTSIADAGPDISVCPGTNTVTLAGNVPVNGSAAWSLVSGPNTPNTSGGNLQSSDSVLTNLVEGLYVYRYYINTNGACAASADTVMIIKEIAANAQPDQRLCKVSSTILIGNLPVYASGSWSFLSGPNTPIIAFPGSPLTAVSGLISGTYKFRWTIAAFGQCGATSSDMQVIIDDLVTSANAGRDTVLCPQAASPQLGTVSLNGVTYSWYPATYLSDTAAARPYFNGTSYPGTYTYTLNTSNGSCVAQDQVVVTIRDYSADFSIVKGRTNIFTAVDAGPGATYNWSFGSDATPLTANTFGPHKVIYNDDGNKTATLTVTDSNKCTNTKTITFATTSAFPKRVVNFTATLVNDSVELRWTIDNANNTDNFVVERSVNGLQYARLGTIYYSPPTNQYAFTDTVIPSGNARRFYRLKIVDHDGKFQYTPVQIINFINEKVGLSVVPNPFTDKINMKLNIYANESVLSVNLFDLRGKSVAARKFQGISQGSHVLQMDQLENLPKGMYILKAATNTGDIFYVKVLKR